MSSSDPIGNLIRTTAREPRAPGAAAPGFIEWIIPLLLGVATVLCFAPALRNGFVVFDDALFITKNYQVQHGFTRDSLVWAFTNTDTGNWLPLTWLSHMLDCRIFGLAAWGHHLTSILIHALNAILLYLLLRRMSGACWRSLAVAALFALHPLRVESVAWAAERKDVLNITFGLVSLWFYVGWCQCAAAGAARGSRYWLSLLFYALALMAKPMLVTLPVLLLFLDYWPLARPQPLAHRLTEKIPFLALAAAASAIALFGQTEVGAVLAVPFTERMANAGVAYISYVGKIFFPYNLAIHYPPQSLAPLRVLAALSALLGFTTLAFLRRQRFPYLWVGLCWFLGTLVPVIGVIQVGSQAMADRYTYWPSVGLYVALCWGVASLGAYWPRRPVVLGAVTATVLLVMGGLTWHQIGYWRDNETLFRHALVVSPDNWVAYDNIGVVLADQPGRSPEALACFEAALRIAPEATNVQRHYNTVLAKDPAGRDTAIRGFRRMLEIAPEDTETRLCLASELARTPSTLPQAIEEFGLILGQKNICFRSHLETRARIGLGSALLRANRIGAALAEFNTLLQAYPELAVGYSYLGGALARIPGREEEAVAVLRHALRLEPDLVEAHFNLGTCLATALGRPAEAIPEYEAVVRAHPDLAVAQAQLGLCLASLPERRTEAIAHLETALRLDPRLNDARRMLERLR